MLPADRIAYLANDGLDRYPPVGQGDVNLAAIHVGDQGRGRTGPVPLFNEALRKFLAEVY